jgi:hypothetical protein
MRLRWGSSRLRGGAGMSDRVPTANRRGHGSIAAKPCGYCPGPIGQRPQTIWSRDGDGSQSKYPPVDKRRVGSPHFPVHELPRICSDIRCGVEELKRTRPFM